MSTGRTILAALSATMAGAGFVVFACATGAADSLAGALVVAAGVAGYVKVTR
jgi:hypothetical protein